MEKKRSSYEEEKKPSVFDRFAEELKGEDGKDGLSAYDLAVQQGFSGSLVEWLDSLKSREPGLRGLPGDDGKPGKDVYEVAVEQGFKGTRRQLLESLNGTNGLSAYELACECGFIGSMNEWLDSLCGKDGEDGEDGLSAYEIAKQEGFTGTIGKWLLSLKGLPGEDGEDGLSAYEVAVKNGFKGSIDKWLESLKGDKGDSFDVTSIRWNNIGNKPSTFEPNRATVRSIIGTSLVGGTDITVTYDPNTGLTTIDSTAGGGGGTRGSITGTLSDQTDLQTALDGKVDENAPITGATHTKITYDAKGLVTGGANATTADIADSTDARYVTDAQLTVIGNTSGTNTGDVTVLDSSEIDLTLTGQQITASLIAGSIDESKLDASVNASLDLADSSVQPGDSITDLIGNNRRVFYTDGTGVINELALGANGTFLQSNGTTSAPSFATPAGSGDVSKVGTPVNNQIGVWTGDGTIEGDTALTFDTTTDTLSTVNIAVSGTVDGRDIANDGSKLDGIESGADVTDATNVGAAGAFMKAVDDTDDITVGTTNKFATATEKTKLGYITVTQAVDLDTMESDIAGKQPLDSDLTTIAGLTATSDNFMQAKAGAWASRTVSQVKTDLGLTGTNSGDQDLSGLVPYTGASGDVDLGANGLTTNDLNISGQTASTIAILDASKNVISASTGTYPSLTELSYGKGVTSAIQTQLNNKQPLDSDLTTLAGLTATTNNFIVAVSSAWASRTPTQVRTTLGLVIGTNVQAYSANLTTWAGVVPGTGVATALGINVGSAGAFVTFNGALGTPSSGTLTNATGLPISGLVSSTSTALGVGSIELGHATDTTLSRSAAGVLAVEGVVVPTISSTDTLTNKRITPRVGTTASSATPAINTDNVDAYSITALAANITSMTTNLSGTPTDFQKLLIRIKDNGTARTIARGASFQDGVVALPTTTVLGKTLLVGLMRDAVDSKWTCEASGSRA